MVALAVIGLAAAGAAHDRSDDSAGRSGLPLIGLTLSSNDIAHFERIYDRLSGDNPDPPFYKLRNGKTTAGGGLSSDTTARSTTYG